MSVTFGFAPIDDQALIVGNPAVRIWSLASVRWTVTHFDPELYIPVTFLSFQLEHLIWGLRPFIYHLDQLLLHTLNALLVSLIAGRITRSRWAGIACGIVFAIHPLQTEAVVWLSGRKDVLSTFFALLAMLLLMTSAHRRPSLFSFLALGSFLLALLAKVSVAPVALFLPLLLLDEGLNRKEAFARSLPFFCAAVALGSVAVLGKHAVLDAASLPQRIGLVGIGEAALLGRMVLPVGLSPFYPIPALTPLTVGIAALVPVLLIGCVIALRKAAPLASAALAWITLLPFPALLNAQADARAAGATFAADRYATLALIGLPVLLIGLQPFLLRYIGERRLRSIGSGMTAIAIALFLPLSVLQTRRWQSADTLFPYAVATYPSSVAARLALARLDEERGRQQDAFNVLRDGLAFGDDPQLHLAAAFLLAQSGRVADAREQFLRVQALAPEFPEPLYGLGGLADHAGDRATAERFYREAIDAEPRYTAARLALGNLLLATKRPADAEDQFRMVLAEEPGNRDALQALITLYDQVKRTADAALLQARLEALTLHH